MDLHDANSEQVRACAGAGFSSVRGYTVQHAAQIAPWLREIELSHLAGLWVDAGRLVTNWRSQVSEMSMERLHQFDISLVAVCVGNELRDVKEGGGWYFSPRLADNLVNVLGAYRQWLDDQGLSTRLSYAMEGGVLEPSGDFQEWLRPVIDACDVVLMNLYPMAGEHWIGTEAFEANRRFLTEAGERKARLERFEARLRRVLEQLEARDKALILSETGFPSGVGFEQEDHRIVPIHDCDAFGDAYEQFMTLLARVNCDFDGRIEAVYIYEWWDNLWHPKIQTENSPIHACFGLCDQRGQPKFDLRRLTAALQWV